MDIAIAVLPKRGLGEQAAQAGGGLHLAETDRRFPIKRFNAQRCKYILISMNNTRVRQSPSTGKFEKDKSSERNDSILPEEATHFGDVVDQRIWTKYGDLLQKQYSFVDVRV